MTGRPESYYVPDRCSTCFHVHRQDNHDDGSAFFCAFGAEDTRPPDGGKGESWDPEMSFDVVLWAARAAAWDNWSKGREVSPCGVCDQWYPQRDQEEEPSDE